MHRFQFTRKSDFGNSVAQQQCALPCKAMFSAFGYDQILSEVPGLLSRARLDLRSAGEDSASEDALHG